MRSKHLPALMFYPGDWHKDLGVQLLTFEQRGVWFELLLRMHDSDERGALVINGRAMTDEEIAILIGWRDETAKLSKILDSLTAKGAASRRQSDGALCNRRMLKEQELSRIRAKAGAAGARQTNAAKKAAKAGPSSSVASSFSEEKIAGSASPTPASAALSWGKIRKLQLAEEEFIAELKRNPAYQGIDIDREIGKLKAWLLTPKGRGKSMTRGRLVNWLNRVDQPLAAQNGHAGPGIFPGKCARRLKDGHSLRPCGRPIAPGQTEPFCTECLEATRAERECLAHLGAMS